MPHWRQLWRNRKPELIWGTLGFLSLVYLAQFQWHRHVRIDSTNAVLDGYSNTLGTPVQGAVVQVLVDENQSVKMGQLLCRLEDSRYRAALLDAESRLAAVQAKQEEARQNNKRSSYLYKRQAISSSVRDDDASNLLDLDAQVRAAEAEVHTARNNLEHTQVLAPADGVIAFRLAQVGYFAHAGDPLFGFIPDSSRWVTAKVKETDLPDFRVGDTVDVRFDAIRGRKFTGQVQSLPPSTEVPFATVPQDPSAGNFTKFVQWHPVRVAVNLDNDAKTRLPIGASAEIRIRRR